MVTASMFCYGACMVLLAAVGYLVLKGWVLEEVQKDQAEEVAPEPPADLRAKVLEIPHLGQTRLEFPTRVPEAPSARPFQDVLTDDEIAAFWRGQR